MQRPDPFELVPEGYQAMGALAQFVNNCGLEKSLLELVKLRASQINGCAFCIAMHATDARKQGESEHRIYLLNAWRDASIYSTRERAALAWTEALTLIAVDHVPDDVYAAARAEFSEAELVKLSWAICAINSWNRMCGAFSKTPVIPK
jgi:AhpD family alkylhydroperoxidase